jgi:hypothetical protein
MPTFTDTFTDPFTLYGKSPEGCAYLRMIRVPNTNAFLAIVDYMCTQATGASLSAAAFCPCSVTDTRCLLCSRVDAQECECPCQCQQMTDTTDTCTTNNTTASIGDSHTAPSTASTCRHPVGLVTDRSWSPTRLVAGAYAVQPFSVVLNSCFAKECHAFRSRDDCAGRLG